MSATDRRWSDADAPDLGGVLAWMEGRPDAPICHDLDAAAAQLRTLLTAAGRLADSQELERLRARVAELEAEAVGFAARLGFGDNVSDPAAPLSDMVDPIADAMEAARDHDDCPTHCEGCGETLAATRCQRCNGLGDIGTTAYEECGECAGAGRIHEGCVGVSYAELAARVAELQQPRPIVFDREVTAEQIAQFRAAWEIIHHEPAPRVLPPAASGAHATVRNQIDKESITLDPTPAEIEAGAAALTRPPLGTARGGARRRRPDRP